MESYKQEIGGLEPEENHVRMVGSPEGKKGMMGVMLHIW